MGEQFAVIVDAGAPPGEMAAVKRAFEAHGIEAEVRDDYIRLSAGELPWVVDVTASIQWIALAFASGFAGKAGADAWAEYRSGGWQGLVHFIKEISSARGNDDGTITVHDPQGPDVLLDPRVPEEALPDLADLDWPAMQDGILGWNEERQEWWFLQANRAPRGISAPRRDRREDPSPHHGTDGKWAPTPVRSHAILGLSGPGRADAARSATAMRPPRATPGNLSPPHRYSSLLNSATTPAIYGLESA